MERALRKTFTQGLFSSRVNVAVILAAFTFSLGLILISNTTNKIFRQRLIDNHQNKQLTIIKSTSNGIESLFTRLINDMLTVASSEYVRDVDSQRGKEIIRDFYKSNQDLVYAGYRMNNDGILSYMYPVDERGINADVNDQDHVIKLFKTHRLVVSGLFRAVEGFDAIAIHAPVFKDGELNGSVATIVKVEHMTDRFLKSISSYVDKTPESIFNKKQVVLTSDRNRGAWLVDDLGTIIFHPENAFSGLLLKDINIFNNKEFSKELELEIWRQRENKIILGDYMFALFPLRIGDRMWTIIYCTPTRDISGPAMKHFRLIWLQTGGVIIAVSLLAIFLVRNTFRTTRLQTEKDLLEEKLGLEQELKSSYEKLNTIIKTVPSGVFTVDLDNNIISWNNTAEKITGYSANEVIGKNCLKIFGTECCEECGLKKIRIDSAPVSGVECETFTKDGRKIILSKNCDLLRDKNGNITGGIESFLDITDKKTAEDERVRAIETIKELDKMKRIDEVKTNFLSMVSHELRTPLSVILGNLSMARRNRYGELPEEFNKKLDVIMKRGWQLNDLIDNMLDLSKIESGRVDLQKTPLDITDLFNDVIANFQDIINKKSLKVSTSYAENAKTVVADKNTLRIMLNHIFSNATKFTNEGGHIDVVTKIEGNYMNISIIDDGIGIPDDEKTKIFERFYQIDDSSTRQFGGTGLGLTMAQEIADIHNGTIEARGKFGEGTEILVKLPSADKFFTEHGNIKKEPAPDYIPALSCDFSTKPRTILLIDEDPDILTGLTEILEGSTIRILIAKNFEEADILIKREQVDLIIINPSGQPSKATSFIKSVATDFPDGIPSILCSEDEAAMAILRAQDLNIIAFIPMPYREEIMIAALKTALA